MRALQLLLLSLLVFGAVVLIGRMAPVSGGSGEDSAEEDRAVPPVVDAAGVRR